MSHCIKFIDYHCSKTENQILRDLNSFAFDRQETSSYHGNMTFHRNIVCKNRDEAENKINELDKGFYDDHAVFYMDGRKKYWLVKCEWHC